MTGLGPGGAAYLAPAARQAIERAEVLVGYKGYLGLLEAGLVQGKQVVGTGMTGEVERCQAAVEAALAGRETVVVCSGDPGVYGMAGLLLEILESRDLLEVVELNVLPGIMAVNAAAALLGAPLMHDFACISLSDLLTPWELIEKRLDAAAGADFVIALYNPRSKRRDWQLPKALEIIARHRGAQTPAGVAREGMRPGQAVWCGELGALDPAQVDMFSLVIVGNSSTRLAGQKMLTPRGYSGKYVLNPQAQAT